MYITENQVTVKVQAVVNGGFTYVRNFVNARQVIEAARAQGLKFEALSQNDGTYLVRKMKRK